MLILRCKNLLKRVPDRYIYLSKLLVLSTSFHVLFLVLVLCVGGYQYQNNLKFVINHRADVAKVKMLPMIKTVPGSVSRLTQVARLQQQAPKGAQGIKKPIQKSVPKKKEPPKTTIAQKEVKQKQTPKPEKRVAPKKPVTKKTNSAQQQTQKRTDKKEAEEIIYLGREDIALVELHNLVQEEIQKAWNPPVGLSKDLACTMKIKIDNKGSIVNVAIEESSAVLSYDISARNAVKEMKIPKQLWAKEVIITFKQ